MQYSVNAFDLVLCCFLVLMLFFAAKAFIPKNPPNYYKVYKYFVGLKLFYAIVFALIYIYYFKGGDTFLYFDGSVYLIDQVLSHPSNFFELFFGDISKINNLNYSGKEYILQYFKGSDTLLTSRILAPFSLICFKQYISTTILFTMITAAGIWNIYLTMCKLYPMLYKYFALGILYYPTIGIWGSGILKDTITLMCVGFIFKSFYNFSCKKNLLRSTVALIIFTYICLVLKPYILYLFLPCMLLWLQNRISNKIKNTFQKVVVVLILSFTFSLGGFFLIQSISSGAGEYALENIEDVAKGFQSWHTYLAETRNQSGYTLGEFDFTITGIIQKIPVAIFVTYYRPFILTDVSNFSLAFEGIQAFILLILTIYVLIRVGFLSFFRIVITNKDVTAFFIFAILFGVTVGLTSYNFGALSRYKIPSIPFFTSILAIVYYLGYLKKKNKINLNESAISKINSH